MTALTEAGTCPVCNGNGQRPVPEDLRRYLPNLYKYDPETDSLPCRNCGGQTMAGTATGSVPLRADGSPCAHEYVGVNRGRCYTEYSCKHCPSKYAIDSGD